jgi:beta-glucosidase
VAADLTAACALSMTAGMDQELCNPTDGRGQAFTLAAAAVTSGALDKAALRRAAGNVLRSKFAAGLFDHPIVDATDAAVAVLDNPTDRALARRVATEGAVLLQNGPDPRGGGHSTLPLHLAAGATIAIIGPLADDAPAYAGGCVCLAMHPRSILV